MAKRRFAWLPANKRILKVQWPPSIDEPIINLRGFTLKDVMLDAFGRDEKDSFVMPTGSLRREAATKAKRTWYRLFLENR